MHNRIVDECRLALVFLCEHRMLMKEMRISERLLDYITLGDLCTKSEASA
ncbi:MAG: hypothetical protein IKU84_05585 [Clostridia bacterium]|nr:hypothetical protein [Clostridia bacterium]